jgi:hypothetical protein
MPSKTHWCVVHSYSTSVVSKPGRHGAVLVPDSIAQRQLRDDGFRSSGSHGDGFDPRRSCPARFGEILRLSPLDSHQSSGEGAGQASDGNGQPCDGAAREL